MDEKTTNNIKKFQENLLCIRKLLGLQTTVEAAKLIGTSRQTVANLEQEVKDMSYIQYFAIKSSYHILADTTLINIKKYTTRISKDITRKDLLEIAFNISAYIKTPFFKKDAKRLGHKMDKFLEDYHKEEYKGEESNLATLYLTYVNTKRQRSGACALKESQEDIEKYLSFVWALENALSLDDLKAHIYDSRDDIALNGMLSAILNDDDDDLPTQK